MMSQLQFDADTARRIEALYLIRDAGRRRELVREALGAVSGERILDAGCGPGFYCLELSEIVGSSGSVLGVDSSLAMLQLARTRCAGRDNVGLLEGEATALPVESATFDGAVCVQVLDYTGRFDRADVQSSGTWTGRRCRFTRKTPL
jgi:ubiquinone/menaquinone biosynthesis C-methylase UbiE